MILPELPPMPQACDITPVSWSNLYSTDQMRAYALAYGEAVREALAKEWEEAHGFDKHGVAARIRSEDAK